VPRSPDATQRHQLRSPTTPSAHRTHPGASMRRYELTDRATARAFARRRTPQNGHAGGLGGARGAAEAQKEVPRSPGATQRRQFRSPTTPSAHWAHPGPSMRRYGSPIARRRARSRAAEHPKMAARAASAARAVPQRRKKRCHGAQARPRGTSLGPPPPPVPPGPTLVRQCDATSSPIARRRALSRSAEHPKMATRAASAARAVPRRRKNRCHGAQARPRGASLGPPPPPVPTGPTLVRQCDATAHRSRDGARVCAPPNTPKGPLGRPRRRARCRGGAKKGDTEPRRDPEAPV